MGFSLRMFSFSYGCVSISLSITMISFRRTGGELAGRVLFEAAIEVFGLRLFVVQLTTGSGTDV